MANSTTAKSLPIVVVSASMLLLAGCNEIIPRFELRDDYMGKRFIQPSRVPGEVERDAYGNPVLPKDKKAP